MIATGLDHAGVAVPNLDAAAAAFEALGFQVTPTAPHLPGGITGNRCIMFAHGYIELLGNLGGQSATLARFLARYQGIHVISLSTDNASLAAQRLGRDPIESARDSARFVRVALTELEPRLQLIQHLTPEAVWRPETLIHPNGAQSLEAIVMTAENPARAAADLSRAAGLPVVPDPDGGTTLRMAHGEVRILRDLAKLFPSLTPPPSLPYVAGVILKCPSLAGQTASAAGVALKFIA